MSWKLISDIEPEDADSTGAKPIFSTSDPNKLIGYEGWKGLFFDENKEKLCSTIGGAYFTPKLGLIPWTDITMDALCPNHSECAPNKCKRGFPYTCHKNTATIGRYCGCGIHSFASLEEISNPANGAYFNARTFPIRIAHTGKIFKASVGIKSYRATMTGIYVPPRIADAPFYKTEFSDDLVMEHFNKGLSAISKIYNLPILDATDLSKSPTSAQFLKQRYGI